MCMHSSSSNIYVSLSPIWHEALSSPIPKVGQTHPSKVAHMCACVQEFVSGDGFGLPSPVPDMMVRGRTLSGAAAKWKDILITTGAKPGDFLTGAHVTHEWKQTDVVRQSVIGDGRLPGTVVKCTVV